VEIRTEKANFAVEFIDIEQAADIAGVWWEPHQVEFLNNSTRFGIDVKARQIAWSFTAALDAVVDGRINPGTPHVFVSINLDEAKEKVRYARAIVEAIDPPARPRLIRDSQTELEFDNGSRLISHPCRPPRGKPRARVYLDEMAHYKEGLDREIYRAALPATTKGDGYIRIGSSPLGAKGLFWEIVTQSLRKYPGYDGWRRLIPWWQVRALCRDVSMARRVAPEMLTEERVRAFGTQALIEIFENMFLEDFQQEYECAWVDELTAWITWEVIKRNQAAHDGLWWHARSVDEALQTIPLIEAAIEKGECEPVLAGGLDVGRQHDLTEFVGVGRSTAGRLPVRLCVSLDRVEYDDQERCIAEIITRLPFTQVLVDKNGIGAQLAENLTRTGKAQGVDFTNATKELWAVEARIQAERGNTPLPSSRDLAYQIHSIKKTTTAAKNNVFDTERNEKHHADKFWAWALAIYCSAHPTTVLIDFV
jgi:phage FluMu gp28-like protein